MAEHMVIHQVVFLELEQNALPVIVQALPHGDIAEIEAFTDLDPDFPALKKLFLDGRLQYIDLSFGDQDIRADEDLQGMPVVRH